MGFLNLYDLADTIDLGGGFWVRVKRHLSDAEAARAEVALVSKRVEATMAGKADGASKADRQTIAQMIDTRSNEQELLVAHIIDWNLTDRQDQLIPLPPYVCPARADGDDPANRVRRESIGLLPVFVRKRILTKIKEFEALGADDLAAFQGSGRGIPAESWDSPTPA